LNQIVDDEHRYRIVDALERREQMEVIVQRTRPKAQRERLQAVTDDVSRWIQVMYDLALRLDGERLPAKPSADADSVIQVAGAQLDASAQALEKSYVQMQLLAAQGADERRTGYLRDEIADQARRLQEVIHQIDDVLP